ncbi:hypothetical protein LTR95_005963 [Oleoguttula sp. CCFEE 5521]
MVLIKVSRTALINPEGAEPKLTVDQMWQGMVIKARKPQEFVKLMEGCEVTRENEHGLTRIVTFKNGWGPPGGKAEEEIAFHAPMRVDFAMQQTGERISNIVSTDCDDSSKLYMTFTIEWPHPDLKEGSDEAKEKWQQVHDMTKQIIQSTNETVRQMVKDGVVA